MDAKSHEAVGGETAIAEIVHVLDELARNVMHGEGEKLFLGEAGVAQSFHALNVIGAGGKREFAAAFPVLEAAVKAHDSGVAAQLEMDGVIFCRGETGVEADEVADIVCVAPVAVVSPTGALDFEIDADTFRAGQKFGVPIALDAAVGRATLGPQDQYRSGQRQDSEAHHEFTQGSPRKRFVDGHARAITTQVHVLKRTPMCIVLA